MRVVLQEPFVGVVDAPSAQALDASLDAMCELFELNALVAELSKVAEPRAMQPEELASIESCVGAVCALVQETNPCGFQADLGIEIHREGNDGAEGVEEDANGDADDPGDSESSGDADDCLLPALDRFELKMSAEWVELMKGDERARVAIDALERALADAGARRTPASWSLVVHYPGAAASDAYQIADHQLSAEMDVVSPSNDPTTRFPLDESSFFEADPGKIVVASGEAFRAALAHPPGRSARVSLVAYA